MDVAVTELRARLSHWLDCVRDGEEVVVTERGVPVARILRLDTSTTIQSLEQRGVISRPITAERPRATGREKPKARRQLSDIVSEQRR